MAGFDFVLQTFNFAACGTQTGFLPSLYDGVCKGGKEVSINSMQDVLIIVANVVRILIAMSGALAVIFIIAAGIFYITSAGDPGRTKRAKDIIVNTVVGLVVILTAYAVVTFIAKGFD